MLQEVDQFEPTDNPAHIPGTEPDGLLGGANAWGCLLSVGIVVNDLAATTAFFVELGLEYRLLHFVRQPE